MKLSKISKGLLLGLSLLLGMSAFAANKGSLHLYEPVMVSGTQMVPGDYQVTWDGTGPNVELKIMKFNKVLATAPAHLIDLSRAEKYDSTVVKVNEDGSKSLTTISFHGRKYSVAIGEGSSETIEQNASN